MQHLKEKIIREVNMAENTEVHYSETATSTRKKSKYLEPLQPYEYIPWDSQHTDRLLLLLLLLVP
jgi:hypothetical protein